MKRNSKPSKASTASSADNITLDVSTPGIAGKTNGNGSKHHKNADNGYMEDLDNHELLRILLEVKEGNFSVRMPGDKLGISGKICDTLNGIILLNEALVEELRKENVTIVDKIESYDYGKFVHILDIEGNKIQLWEPKD